MLKNLKLNIDSEKLDSSNKVTTTEEKNNKIRKTFIVKDKPKVKSKTEEEAFNINEKIKETPYEELPFWLKEIKDITKQLNVSTIVDTSNDLKLSESSASEIFKSHINQSKRKIF